MELRNKLLFYFALFVLVTLVAFGLSSYHITQEGSIESDRILLEKLAHTQAATLAILYRVDHSTEHLIAHINKQITPEHTLLLLDLEFRVLNLDNKRSDSNPNISHALSTITSDPAPSGSLVFDNQTFIWAKSGIENSNWILLQIYSPEFYAAKYRGKLAKRLMAIALLIFWIAIWGALITATVITRKIKQQQNKIEYQASHDVMTGLQNRNYLANKIDQIIASKKLSSLSVILIGINRFREINNTLGHDFGDLLLKEFSTRLKTEFWSNDTIARFGSDQYALILPLTDHTHWKIVIEKIAIILNTPFSIQDIHIVSDVSIGVSVFPEHGRSAAQLLRCAEVAMYLAKKTGVFYECYAPETDPNSIDRLQMISELNFAIVNDELELHYQPKFDIENGKLIGSEALLRWNNTARGRIPPDVFIPLAEQGSSIWNLTEWVLHHSIRQCSSWHQAGNPLSISVNLSARLLIEEKIVGLVAHLLDKHDFNPAYLILEITESAMMVDPVRARTILGKLHDLGVQLSIDDFGTGYTSISQIQTMPVSEIKIDKSFVLNMLSNTGDAMLVKLIIDMGHGLGHLVIAEGIEDQVILDRLKSMGCDIAQGYHLGRPMPVLEFDRFILSRAEKL